ncbi:MAG: FAD-dependent oxidoreductase [Clostridia bacterium]|nr:FAD-dependent oxidoreductase [Clostridia bacterium]
MIKTIEHEVEFCVVGGGLAGMCAAIAAARHGHRVALIQERPVLGGNASSEIRMWVCGAQGKNNRETGIIEEINLEAMYRNPYKLYPVWDSILYGKVTAEPNITLFLNTSVCEAETVEGEIRSVTAWQMTTQTFHRVRAKLFADCSGDSILAPLTDAAFRVGREAREEFGEKTSIETADKKTMGMSCLIQARKTDEDIEFIAPTWAKKLTDEDIARRAPHMDSSGENFWYLELGGDRDSIGDTENVRDELVALAFGFWDYYKNSGKFPGAEKWQLDFLGFLPGKRESRRMEGPYIMHQGDVLSGGHFDDVVAYGGWPLDDHHPGGFYHLGAPNVWGDVGIYGIPYRALYSRNIGNLFFAGRNISMTHAAMSSARVMMTCAVLGQAVGTAAALALMHETSPAGVYACHIEELQQSLLRDDCFLPYLTRRVGAPTKRGIPFGCEHAENLRNGRDRNHPLYGDGEQGVYFRTGEEIGYTFTTPCEVKNAHIVFDSDLDRTTLPGDSCEQYHSMRANITPESPKMCVPKTLVRDYTLAWETADGKRETREITDNIRRMNEIPVGKTITRISLIPHRLWGERDEVHLFSFDLY